MLMLLNLVITLLMIKGVGIWGIRIPAAWGYAIVNFVWWIGIGHAGTLISAFLLLLHQRWRTSVNRFAEAMTIFAVMCAGMFPLLQDRKSTRLNSSHPSISYAVFCLKKKKKKQIHYSL